MNNVQPDGNGAGQVDTAGVIDGGQGVADGDQVDDIIARLKAENEHIKKSQQGSDAAASKFKTQLDGAMSEIEALKNELKSKLTDSERLMMENREKEEKTMALLNRVAELEKANQQAALKEGKLEILNRLNLNKPHLINVIYGDTLETFEANAKQYLDDLTGVETDVKKGVMNNPDPAKGDTIPGAKEITREVFDALPPNEKARLHEKIANREITII